MKKVGIALKSKQASNQLEPVTRNVSCIGYCYNSKPNICTNIALSSTSTRFNPYFGLHIYCMLAKAGIKSLYCNINNKFLPAFEVTASPIYCFHVYFKKNLIYSNSYVKAGHCKCYVHVIPFL